MTRRAPGDGALFKRKDGYWVGGVELPPGPDGKRRQKKVVRRNRNDCLSAVREIKRELDAGVFTGKATTLGKWLDYWISDILPQRDVRPGTITYYRNGVRLYIQPTLGHRRLDKLTPAEIRDMYKDLRLRVSSHAALKADKTLRAALKAAVRDGLIQFSIMDRVDKPAHLPVKGESFDTVTAVRIITTAERTQGKMWAARWALGFVTGAREGEVLGLEWDRVDFKRGLIDVSWQLQRLQKSHGCDETCGKKRPSFCPQARWDLPATLEWRECEGSLVWTRPKTKAGTRVIPLIPQMADILKSVQEASTHNLVFHHPDGAAFAPDQDQKMWRKLLVDCRIPHLRQHSIRYSTATLLMEAGVDAHVIASILGHTDIAVTRGYQNVSTELARKAWENLSELLPTQNSVRLEGDAVNNLSSR